MYEDFVKLTQDSLKPVMKMAENNTAMAVKLMQRQTENASEMMQGKLEAKLTTIKQEREHMKALMETKDLNAAVEMQQKYVEGLNEKLIDSAKENAAVIEAAIAEAGKIFEGSFAEVQAQAKKTVEKMEKEINKAGKKAA